MPKSARTIKDLVYKDILLRDGALSNSELAREALKHPNFRKTEFSAIEKDVDRFVKHYEAIGVLTKQDGKLRWLPLSSHPQEDNPKPQPGQFVLGKDGFLTSRAGIICRHCMMMIDLTQVSVWRRFKSDTLLRMLHVHHFFWVVCPFCKVKARYDMFADVKPIIPERFLTN
jgi:hypothetical protein